MPSDSNTKSLNAEGYFSLDIDKIESDEMIGLTALTLIGRDGGAANGELDPTPVLKIYSDPESYGFTPGEWRSLKSGCPFSGGSYARKGEGIAINVDADKGSLTLLCRCPSHNHAESRKRTDKNGNVYWVFQWKNEHHKKRGMFPPFKNDSDASVVGVLLQTIFSGARYDGEEYVRLYDDGIHYGRKRYSSARVSKYRGKWVRYSDAEVKTRISQAIDSEWYEVVTLKDGVPVTSYKKFKLNASKINSMYAILKNALASTASTHGNAESVFDVHRPHIGLQGSVYDLESDRCILPDQSAAIHLFNRAEQQIPTPMWSDRTPDPERWFKFLSDCWGHQPDYQDRLLFIQEWVGVALAGMACQVATHVMLKGRSGAGKSQFIEVIEALFGNGALVSGIKPSQVGDKFGLDVLKDSRLNTCAEISTRGLVNAAAMKALQSGDRFEAEIKHGKKKIPFRSQAAWLMGCNNSWTPDERDESVFRRWKILTFDRAPDAKDRVIGLGRIIATNELTGIAKWAVEGYRRWRKQGRKFTRFASSDAAMLEWKKDTDPLAVWLDEYVEPTSDRSQFLTSSEHYKAYVACMEEMGIKKPLGQRTFSQKIKDVDWIDTHKASSTYHHVRLKDPDSVSAKKDRGEWNQYADILDEITDPLAPGEVSNGVCSTILTLGLKE